MDRKNILTKVAARDRSIRVLQGMAAMQKQAAMQKAADWKKNFGKVLKDAGNFLYEHKEGIGAGLGTYALTGLVPGLKKSQVGRLGLAFGAGLGADIYRDDIRNMFGYDQKPVQTPTPAPASAKAQDPAKAGKEPKKPAARKSAPYKSMTEQAGEYAEQQLGNPNIPELLPEEQAAVDKLINGKKSERFLAAVDGDPDAMASLSLQERSLAKLVQNQNKAMNRYSSNLSSIYNTKYNQMLRDADAQFIEQIEKERKQERAAQRAYEQDSAAADARISKEYAAQEHEAQRKEKVLGLVAQAPDVSGRFFGANTDYLEALTKKIIAAGGTTEELQELAYNALLRSQGEHREEILGAINKAVRESKGQFEQPWWRRLFGQKEFDPNSVQLIDGIENPQEEF